jgi:hypothetical protein
LSCASRLLKTAFIIVQNAPSGKNPFLNMKKNFLFKTPGVYINIKTIQKDFLKGNNHGRQRLAATPER